MKFEISADFLCKPLYYDYNLTEIPVISNKTTYNDFFKNYMFTNIPCIIRNVASKWNASTKWLNQQQQPDLTTLKTLYGTTEVCVYNCSERFFNSQKTETCTFANFLDQYWKEHNSLKYLKDWHLKNTYKNDDFYEVPIYFASDWLNEFLVENSEDDYRFVYMGRCGTWTPFHVDVFTSYSWSANVCGKKKWILFPPGQEKIMADNFGNLPYDIEGIYEDKKHFEVIQNAGEAIFVPSGWCHQVKNIEDTISVNHNWLNACNIRQMWSAIRENIKLVEKEIEDCRDMDNYLEHSQLMLKASFGMDFSKFFDFLQFICLKRLSLVKDNSESTIFHGHVLGKNHAVFDLRAIKEVLQDFPSYSDVNNIHLNNNPYNLLEEITICLEKYKK